MRKINEISELNSLITAHFGREYVSNWFVSRDDAEKYIVEGRISACELDGSLFILRERETCGVDFCSLYYCMKKGYVPNLSFITKTTVAETPFRERDVSLMEADESLCKAGFEREFTRRRMAFVQKDEPVPTLGESMKYADENDIPLIEKLLSESFSPLTGCLPDKNETASAVREKRFILHKNDGLLHFEKSRASFELRHLCVAQSSRGQGIAGELVRAYNGTVPKKSIVWVREGYAPAEKTYENNGYTADGMHSSVLIYKK